MDISGFGALAICGNAAQGPTDWFHEEIKMLQHLRKGYLVMKQPTLKGMLKKGVFSVSS